MGLRVTYPGGKGSSFRNIISMMPPHHVYIETHVGSGAVLKNKKPAEYSIAIDIDPVPLYALLCGHDPTVIRVNADAVETLRKLEWTGGELVYADPPYVLSARKSQRPIYKHEYTDEQHQELLSTLLDVPALVMVSGYRCELYDDMLSEWRREDFSASTRQGTAIESVWCNFPDTGERHDYRYIGDNYRARERIKRKEQRWVKRLTEMPDIERERLLRNLLGTVSPEQAMTAYADVFGDAPSSSAPTAGGITTDDDAAASPPMTVRAAKTQRAAPTAGDDDTRSSASQSNT